MARSKLRKSNSALSRGQMVRIENRFTLRLEEDTYDPDENGACCTANSDGEKCVCANTTARECCEQKGDFFPGISCDADPCPCEQKGACCIPCDNDEAVFGICVSNRTRAECTALGGQFNLGVDCGSSNPCPECNDSTIYEAKIACCEPCPDGTNTGRNGTCVTYTGTGTTPAEAEAAALSQCSGEVGNIETGVQGSVADPCASSNGGCKSCTQKTRPYCLFCPVVTGTECESTQSGECIEVEVDFSGNIVDDPGTGQIVYNPTGSTDITCADIAGTPQACSGAQSDCVTCQEVCCCQDGIATPTLPENCTGKIIELSKGQVCDNTLICDLPFYCIECDSSTCTNFNVLTSGNQCIVEVTPEFSCRVVNTNKPCPGFERPSDSDVLGEVDCDVFGAASNPTANGGCGCPSNCDLAGLADFINQQDACQKTFCSDCSSCSLTLVFSAGYTNCGSYSCCAANLGQDACDNVPTPGGP